ncbi:helix-turn-helix domain-containing protein [Tepidiphilus baoligensis]|uniref:helix-turn-helix domain-containing protein n=1 Tax=Tepidiphilus baoligensis TaxID=2698687 RepID=UPI00361C53DD
MERIEMSGKALKRLEVLRQVLDGVVGQKAATERLGLTDRQVRRLLRRYEVEDTAGLVDPPWPPGGALRRPARHLHQARPGGRGTDTVPAHPGHAGHCRDSGGQGTRRAPLSDLAGSPGESDAPGRDQRHGQRQRVPRDVPRPAQCPLCGDCGRV